SASPCGGAVASSADSSGARWGCPRYILGVPGLASSTLPRCRHSCGRRRRRRRRARVRPGQAPGLEAARALDHAWGNDLLLRRLVCRRDPGPREGGGRRAEAPDRHGPPQRRGRRRGARAVAGERAGPGAAVPAAARRAVGRSRRRRRAGAGRARRRRAGRPGAGAGAGLPGGWGAAAGRREGGQGFRRGDWQAWLSRVLPPFRPLGRGWPACARLRSRTATAGMVRKVA
ncbi:unnamed protein product, partial [Prorocentrum cordatum]